MGGWRVGLSLAACALLLVVILLNRCGSPLRYSLGDLEAKPEARLFAPDSVVLTVGGAAQGYGGWGGAGYIPARTNYMLGVAASPAEVEAFYRRELARRGWTPDAGSSYRVTTIDERAVHWRKGDLAFHLAFLRKDVEASDPRARQYATYYAIVLTEIVRR